MTWINAFFFQKNPSSFDMLDFLILNTLVSIVVTLILMYTANIDVIKRKGGFFWLSVGISSFVPGIGLPLIIFVIILLKLYVINFNPLDIQSYPFLIYARKKPVNTIAYPIGWATMRLYSDKFNAVERMQALRSLHKGRPREVNSIYRSLVSDEQEELRISAFSLLENQHTYLQKRIHALLKKFNAEENEANKAWLSKQLALLYWENIYRGLADHEFLTILHERSTYYAQYSLNTIKNDPTLYILLASLAREKNDKEACKYYLAEAAKNHAALSNVTPYFAEFAYQQKDFKEVRSLLSSDVSFKYLFKMSKIVNFWCMK